MQFLYWPVESNTCTGQQNQTSTCSSAQLITGTAGYITGTAGYITGTAGYITGTAGYITGTAGYHIRSPNGM